METASASEKCKVLVVDDEQGILNAVRRELSVAPLGRYRYDVETFSEPLEALERAKVQEFEAVLSDYRMPVMDGLEFLKQLAKIQPDCGRIVLSGQTDLDALIRMINETHIYRFVPKPWSSQFLKSSLVQAINFRRANIENRRLAYILRSHGVDLPIGALNETDHILVVDEDVAAANVIARSLTQRNWLDDVFRQVREDAHGRAPQIDTSRISVQVCDSGAHAMKMAEGVAFSCVIADSGIRGPEGGDFLSSFAERQPDCAPIMISSEASMNKVVIALDLAHIHAFIAKPWNDFELRAAVAQALTRRRVVLENRILAQMCRARDLGSVD